MYVEVKLLQGFAGSPGRRIWRIGEDLRRSSETELKVVFLPLPLPLYI